MRILSITNRIAFPTDELSFQQTWYYLLSCQQIKKSNSLSIICDRNMKFEYLPSRVNSQYLLFNPEVIILQLESKNENMESIVKNLISFRNLLTSGIRIFLLPNQDLNFNVFLSNSKALESYFNVNEFKKLLSPLNSKFSPIENRNIYEYLNLVI